MSSVTVTDRRTRSLLRAPAAARRRAEGWLIVLVGALVAGIFGMHALASHGTTEPIVGSVAEAVGSSDASLGAATTSAMSTTTDIVARWDSGPSDTAHDAHSHGSPQSAIGASTAVQHDGSGHPMSSMVMLCVVVLAAAVTLLGLLTGGLRTPRLPDTFAPAAVRTAAHQWVRGAGPPPEWQFSVIRC